MTLADWNSSAGRFEFSYQQPLPSHHRPRRYFYRLIRAVPDVLLYSVTAAIFPAATATVTATARLPPPLAYIAWPAWLALYPLYRIQTVVNIGARIALMVLSRPMLSRNARFRAFTSYSAGWALIRMLYSMWSSCDSLAVRIAAARPSILPVSSSGLLPGTILKMLRRRERLGLAQAG